MSYQNKHVEQTGAGTSSLLIFPKQPVNFQCLIHAIIKSGAPTYTIEYSINGEDYIPLGAADRNVSDDTTLVFPVHSIRVAVTGTGTVKLIALFNDGGFNE